MDYTKYLDKEEFNCMDLTTKSFVPNSGPSVYYCEGSCTLLRRLDKLVLEEWVETESDGDQRRGE